MYAKGSSTATKVGTGLTSPTGVAVDGAGDVFIADGGSGTVVEVPNGPNGLMAGAQVTLKSGLGTNLKLAADSNNDLYISDPSNGRVVKLSNVGVTVVRIRADRDRHHRIQRALGVAVDSNDEPVRCRWKQSDRGDADRDADDGAHLARRGGRTCCRSLGLGVCRAIGWNHPDSE